MHKNWLGLDIGGANIKYDDTQGNRGSLVFEIWKQPDEIASTLQRRIADWKDYRRLAVTMTGELADCFTDKQQGVTHICDAVCQACPQGTILFYQTNGHFVPARAAKSDWILSAASNWHALASWIGQHIPDCIVIDIGSTTTDIIPVQDGRPLASGSTDWQRMQQHELLYTGVIRSPLAAVAPVVEFDQRPIHLAHENFATMMDVYLVLERISEDQPGRPTADGRPATRSAAFRRLAKMICCDLTEVSTDCLVQMATQAAAKQAQAIGGAILSVVRQNGIQERFVVCGEGDWLGEEVVRNVFNQPQIICQNRGRLVDSTAEFSTASAVAQLAQRQAEPASP